MDRKFNKKSQSYYFTFKTKFGNFFYKNEKKIEARNLKQVRILIKSKKLDLFLGVFIKIFVSNIFLLISIIALDCMSVSMSVRPSIHMYA